MSAAVLTPPVERKGRYERPYMSPRLERSRSRPRPETVDGPTREYALSVADVARARRERAAAMGLTPHSPGGRGRDAIEFVVDVPVWSPGCFSDLTTMHSLRDTTLSHVHTLIGHLAGEHAVLATYRILARSPSGFAWGAIRLAPSLLDGNSSCPRRTSFVFTEPGPVSAPRRKTASPRGSLNSLSFDSAVASDDEAAPGGLVEGMVLRDGYSADATGTPAVAAADTAANEVDEDAVLDSLIKAEVDARGHKEGACFVFTLKDQVSLIMI